MMNSFNSINFLEDEINAEVTIDNTFFATET